MGERNFKKNSKTNNRKIGRTIAIAAKPKGISAIHSEKEHRKQQKLLVALEQVSKTLTVEVDLHKILEDMAKIIAKAVGAKWVNFWELTPDKKAVFISAHYGMTNAYMEHSRKYPIRLGTAWIGRTVKSGKAWGTSDILTDPNLIKDLGPKWRTAIRRQDYRALLCLPTVSKRGVVGGMCLYFPGVHPFTDFEMRLATVAANQAATAITNAQIFSDLAAERNKTIAIVNSLADGIIMYDPEGRVTFFNPRAEELLWVPRKLVEGRNLADIRLQQKRRPKETAFLENIISISTLPVNDFETKEFSIAAPQKISFQVAKLPVRGVGNENLGHVAVLHDITREKESEEMKLNFVSVASHQLRTPLSEIKWALATVLNQDVGPLNEEQKNILGKTHTTNDYLIRLVSDLLDVSRIEEGRFGYVFKRVQLYDAVREVFEEISHPAGGRRRQLSFVLEKPDRALPPISADASKLRIAIFNILDNAVKYTPKGSVQISFRVSGKTLSCIVKDTGIGIPRDQQKFIFQKFFRARNAIRVQTEGSGLGLWIANEVMERHKGIVTVESAENKGSSFSLNFPLDPRDMPRGKVEGL
ncbi:MAG: GAF domain-containing sensor histidine kinase [Candidatus Sungbacteria bacterium]|nr:GAF domain-containing sensor histidine kinase [Candidatus Sungbacteria bacterium]